MVKPSAPLSKSLRLLCGGTIAACLATAACLPDPQIQVPDFAPSPVSDGGTVVRTDGPSGDLGTARWGAYGAVASAPLLRAGWVADPGLSEAYAVGHGGTILHRTGDGDWQVEKSGTDANLYAVAARSATEVFAVGDRGVILRRVGGSWQQEGSELHMTTAFFGVAMLTTGEVIAVGDLGTVARRQTAGAWVIETSDALIGTGLRAVWGTQLEGLYAVGLGGVIVRRVQGKWERDTLAMDPSGRGNYYAITGAGEDVHIAGEYGVVLHRSSDGSRWVVDKLPPLSGMVTAPHIFSLYLQGGELLAAGAGGLIERLSAGSWTIEPTGTANDLYGLAGAGLRSVLTVGAHGTVLRRQ